MPKGISLLTVSDMTGGLNLLADQFQLRGADSPDLLNVDLDPRGGFSVRDAAIGINSTALSNTPKNIWRFAKTDGTDQILVQDGNDLAYGTGGNFTAFNPDALTLTGTMRAATFKDACYVQRNAEQAVAQEKMTTLEEARYAPNPAAQRVYDELYGIYRELHDSFGGVRGAKADFPSLMKRLLAIRERETAA